MSLALWKPLVRVLGVVLRLLDNRSIRICITGKARAEELKRAQRFNDRGLFDWTPVARTWLE